jgi:hypothetical protein
MSLKPYTGPLDDISFADDVEEPKKKPRSAKDMLGDIRGKGGMRDFQLEEAQKIVPLLARRAAHIPGNNYCQDWMQFMRNNHPLFGICCHHRLHPLRKGHRIILLIASIAFGLAATNIVYLLHIHYGKDMDDVLIRIYLENDTNVDASDLSQIEITYGALSLWTFGSVAHSIFDLCMWYLSACACFLPGGRCQNYNGFQKIGSYCIVAIAAVLFALATFAIVVRARYENRLKETMEQSITEDDEVRWDDVQTMQSLAFLFGYIIELGLVYFAYWPLIATTLFSGVLSLGFLPFLRGRPGQYAAEQERQAAERKAAESAASESSDEESGGGRDRKLKGKKILRAVPS